MILSELLAQDAATDEEIAAWLSQEEGRLVSVAEVRLIGGRAMRKVRAALQARGIIYEDLALETWQRRGHRGEW